MKEQENKQTDTELREDCPFCDKGKIKSDVIERDGCFIFEPLNPVVKGHLLVVPTNHIEDFTSDTITTECVMRVAGLVAKENGGEYNLITSKGKSATQSVFHFHVHLVPRKEGDNLMLPWSSLHQREQQLKAELLEKVGEERKNMGSGRAHIDKSYWIEAKKAKTIINNIFKS